MRRDIFRQAFKHHRCFVAIWWIKELSNLHTVFISMSEELVPFQLVCVQERLGTAGGLASGTNQEFKMKSLWNCVKLNKSLTWTARLLCAEPCGGSGGIFSWSYDHNQQLCTDTGAVDIQVKRESGDSFICLMWRYKEEGVSKDNWRMDVLSNSNEM